MQTPTQPKAQAPQSANMGIYDQVRSVPTDAIAPIQGGPLRGKSNINPQWRIEMLTRLFGPAGIGWKVEQTARWSESTGAGETAVFCEVNLYVKKDGQWSEPIFGQGGNILIRRSTEWVNGAAQSVLHIDDEAYKKAYTDAISVACKALGFASDIYYAQEETKYGTFRQEAAPAEAPVQKTVPIAVPVQAAAWPWTPGLKEITPRTANWNASVTQVSKLAGMSVDEILGRISQKFNITEENFKRLLTASNRLAA